MKVGGKKKKPKNGKRVIKGGESGEGKRQEIKEEQGKTVAVERRKEGGWIDACFFHSALTRL